MDSTFPDPEEVYHRERFDRKWGSEESVEEPEYDSGGVMPVDSVQRSDIDGIADDYMVELQYDEGIVHVKGSSDAEVRGFVDELYSSERSMEETEHPHEFSIPSALEEHIDRGDGVSTDGGWVPYSDSDDGSSDEVKGIPLAGSSSKVREVENQSEEYMGCF